MCAGDFNFHHLQLSPLILTTVTSKTVQIAYIKNSEQMAKIIRLRTLTKLTLSKMTLVSYVLLCSILSFRCEILTIKLSAKYSAILIC